MAVLSDVDIKEIINSDRGILILNGNDKNITGTGYDLRIGFICDSDTGEEPFVDAKSDRYELLPGHRYLVVSKEYIYLSDQYMATLHSRGSYVLKGLSIASTTIDPNYSGCVHGSLINISQTSVFIKKQNSFATMVIHELCTATKTSVSKNEAGRPMTARETLNGEFCNVNKKTGDAAIRYGSNIQQQVEDEYNKAKERISIRIQQQKDADKYARTIEEKETEMREQVNGIEQQLKEMQEGYIKERRKRYLLSGVLGIIITLLVFMICRKIIGESFMTFIFSGIAGIISILGGVVTLNDFGVIIRDFRKRKGK